MAVFKKHDTHGNKKIAASYVLKLLSEISEAELVSDVATGSGSDMIVGIQSSKFGLVHVTCSSGKNPNGKIGGWKPHDLEMCTAIDHLAFVWEGAESRVMIFLLEKLSALKLAKACHGNYAKEDIRNIAFKSKSYHHETTS